MPASTGSPAFQHIAAAHGAVASPPVEANGAVTFGPRRGTPQPQLVSSRPTSRNNIRHMSAGLVQQQQQQQQHQPPQNGFAYMTNPSIYNPNLAARASPYPQFATAPQSVPPLQPPPPTVPQQQAQQMTPVYIPADPRAAAMASTFPEQQIPVNLERSKSRSIFTPIDDRGSVLARHFGLVRGAPPRAAAAEKVVEAIPDSSTSKSVPPVLEKRTAASAVASSPAERKTSSRSSSAAAAGRPKLTVQIPSEHSDATAESTSSAGNRSGTTPNNNNSTITSSGNVQSSAVVLPPPSPSAGTNTSAGAQGPPNPFARPAPPSASATTTTTTTAPGPAQNNTAYASNSSNGNGNGNNSSNNNTAVETPTSALPSRFVSDALLPSPSSFFAEWGFGRTGPDTSMLPSPLAFPTPSVQTGPGFLREDEGEQRKRKSEDVPSNPEGVPKRVKT